MASRTRSGVIYAVMILLFASVTAVVVRVAWHAAQSHFSYDHCTAGAFDVDPGQAAIASTMVGVATERGLPHRAAVLVLAAALQESKLRNLAPNAGDRDSVGVLQQRPSQGWGTQGQLGDVHYATGAFLNALVKIPNWQTLPLADAVQDVQVSADGGAYAQHEVEAQALADALVGAPPAAITCSFDKPSQVAPVATVVAQLSRDLPVNQPVAAAGTVTVPGAGWQTAGWFVANADRLGIEHVAYAGHAWSRGNGWRTQAAAPSAVIATMYHP